MTADNNIQQKIKEKNQPEACNPPQEICLFRVNSEVGIKKRRESDKEKSETVKRILLKEEMRESSKYREK